MPVSVESFQQAADSAWFCSSDIILGTKGHDGAKVGNLVFSSRRKTNDAAMAAFRDALSRKHGLFGEHAFDSILGGRRMLHRSLRACDVKAVLSNLPPVKKNRFISEISRQLDTSPRVLELSPALQKELRRIIATSPMAGISLKDCRTQADIARMASERIDAALKEVCDSAAERNRAGGNIRLDDPDFKPGGAAETSLRPDEPAGLKDLAVTFGKGKTSVEDRMKKGTLGVGMPINRLATHPMLLVKLKTNGVEPGFICKRDWSAADTRSMLADIDSEESLAALEDLKRAHPGIAEKCRDLPLREQIMLFGRAHPACMAAVSEYVLERGMADEESAIYKAFCNAFPGTPPEDWGMADIVNVKKALFAEIRDAVLSVKPGSGDYEKSPVFRHFQDRHIVKLDYNEGDRIVAHKAASAGKFMRPERIRVGRKMGQIYRLQTATTADKSSAGAVTEALANDLTRLAGVPSQELSIVRGEYSDGHPKLMLQARFAEGYKDMEEGYIKDGQIVPPNGEETESLGRYKAFFLVTADRDAVGSRGQNKGFVKGKDGQPGRFFAIDPGHSLESNGRFLEVSDDLSFKDTYGFSTKPRFRNFSVFDDDTRFAKVQGALDLRILKQSGKIEKLFEDYRRAFDPGEAGIGPAEKELRRLIHAEIKKKEDEFNDSLAKVLTAAENQIRLHDDLAEKGPVMQEKAIETIANLEKLTSPTTWVSPKGETPLKHLAVIPETRMPWRGHVEGDNIVYHCDQPLSPEAQAHLRAMASSSGADLFIDADGCARLTVSLYGAEKVLDVFSEDNVARITHPDESAARALGKTGLEEAKRYVSSLLPHGAAPAGGEAASFVLPDSLEVRTGGSRYLFRKKHFEAMFANTPEAERPKSIGELRAVLAARIRRGKAILMSVFAGNGHRYEATPRNIACVTLALHAGTVLKGEYNERGAFSVEDNDGRLYQWLDTCREIYLRTSTHAKAYHHDKVDGHMNMPRGIDIPEGMGGLMGGMRTLHYFTLPQEHMMGKRRLYLKCETYGIFRSTISQAEEEASRSQGMQTRQKRTGDTRESIKHCLSLATVFSRMGASEGNRKENFPSVVNDAMKAAQEELVRAGMPELAAMLSKDVGGRVNGGIPMLMGNLAKVLDAAPANSPVVKKIRDDLLDAAVEYAGQRTGGGEARLGNEVMLDMHEIV